MSFSFPGGVPDPHGLGTPPVDESGELLSGLVSGIHSFSPSCGLASVFGFPHAYHPLFRLELNFIRYS